ncbi:hypothetical protein [Methylobacterium planeticum]|uniref:Uncharacterized protein n=1 Tax=Methylobacterium planeticum TaxID=2615211 RepID=A0A6N6MSG9_9HYPH|nr:hypothetical protein [Methylobacterium planeticum]KAB1073221.1 hypothetical protein F6X51_12830 [Methylobacterium planeticum]
MSFKGPPSRHLESAADDGSTQSEIEGTASSGTLSAHSAQLLRVIAETLGMPISVFDLREAPNARAVAGSEAANECTELVRAYRRIRDPAKRRRLLELVRSAGAEE